MIYDNQKILLFDKLCHQNHSLLPRMIQLNLLWYSLSQDLYPQLKFLHKNHHYPNLCQV